MNPTKEIHTYVRNRLELPGSYPPIISGDPAKWSFTGYVALLRLQTLQWVAQCLFFALIFFFSPTKTGKVQMDFAIFWVDESYKPGDRRCWGSYERRYSEITVLWSEIKISPFWRREAVKNPAQLFLWSFQSFRFHSWNLGTILLECEMCHICDAFGFPRLSSAAPRFFQWRFQFSKAFSADFSAGDDYRFLTIGDLCFLQKFALSNIIFTWYHLGLHKNRGCPDFWSVKWTEWLF